MKTIQKDFKTKVVAKVKPLAEKFKLGEVEVGEDNEIVRAPFLPMAGGLNPAVLVIAKKNGHLAVQVRRVIYFGSKGSITNRTVNYLVKHLFCPPRQRDEGLDENQVMIAGLMVDQFISGRRTFADLMAQVAAATNDVITFSRAIPDPFDGEIYIEALAESSFENVPDSLEDLIGGVLMHADLLRRCEHIIREALIHNPEPSRQWVEGIVALSREKSDPEDKAKKAEEAEKEEEVTI